MILSQKYLVVVIAVLAWFAVIVQLSMGIRNTSLDTGTYLVRFFSYFTILTNLMVALGSTSLWLFPQNAMGVFFGKERISTALTLYIIIVGLVYNVALRFLWQPQGMARLTDELLHSVVPLLVLLYWWRSPKREVLRLRDISGWLVYPFIYLLYTLGHGAISGFYPYPFVDVNVLGITKVLMNCGVVALIIVLLGALLIGIARCQHTKGGN